MGADFCHTIVAKDVAIRERENKSPNAKVALLKHSSLLMVKGPAKYGGGEQPWNVALRAVRELAKKDGFLFPPSALDKCQILTTSRSIGMLLGYHLA